MIEVSGLKVVRDGRTVLDVDHLAVAEGEVLAVIGPNGAGKSTLLQALALLLPAPMTYRFGGRVAQLPQEGLALRRQMAVVFQQPLLLDATVAENVGMGLRLRGVAAAERGKRTGFWLERFGVSHLAGRHARALSGGEAQRVSLARAMAAEPRVLFLDEPFGAIDVLSRAAILQELRPILNEAGVTTFFVTHDFTEIPPLADRMAVIMDGRIVQTGTPREVFAQPATPAVEALVQAATHLIRALT